MSMDTKVLLWYEPQDYLHGFPQTEVDKFNQDPDLHWLDELKTTDGATYIGWLDHYPYKVLEDNKADQVFLIGSGEWGWKEVERG